MCSSGVYRVHPVPCRKCGSWDTLGTLPYPSNPQPRTDPGSARMFGERQARCLRAYGSGASEPVYLTKNLVDLSFVILGRNAASLHFLHDCSDADLDPAAQLGGGHNERHLL